jgi:hypothetical protein
MHVKGIFQRNYYQFCVRLLTISSIFVDKLNNGLKNNALPSYKNNKKKLLNGITFFQNLDNIQRK